LRILENPEVSRDARLSGAVGNEVGHRLDPPTHLAKILSNIFG